MKCLLVAVFAFFASLTHALNIVGDDAYAPYSFKESGKITGIYTDIITEAVKRLGGSHEINGMPWKRGLSLLKAQKIDALYPPYFRPKERPYMAYSIDILDETPAIFCQKSKANGLVEFPKDYQGVVIGRNAGFVTPLVDDAKKKGIIKLQETKGMSANLQKLINGRVDCYVNDRLSVLYALKKLQAKGRYDGVSVVETSALPAEQGFIAVHTSAGKDITDFLKAFNKEITNMKADGSIQKVIDKYTK